MIGKNNFIKIILISKQFLVLSSYMISAKLNAVCIYMYVCTYICVYIYMIVVQLLNHVQLFATSWTAECQASLSFTISQSLLKLTSIESVMTSKGSLIKTNKKSLYFW